MANPHANKVIINGSPVIDLTGDTVDAAHLMQGYTAHDRSGALIVGTASGGGGEEALVTINGGVNETITYLGVGGSGTVTLNENGQGSVVLPKGQYTLTGSRSGYQVTVNVQNDVETVNAWPDGAIFWYGRQVVGAMAGTNKRIDSWQGSTINQRVPDITVAGNLSVKEPKHPSNWNGYSGTAYQNVLFDITGYNVVKAKGHWTGHSSKSMAWLMPPTANVTTDRWTVAEGTQFPMTNDATIQVAVGAAAGNVYIPLAVIGYYGTDTYLYVESIWCE